jgi:hypothetical protein
MVDRPTETELALDAIDEHFKIAIGGMYGDLGTYGVAPIRTFEDAKALAETVWHNATITRRAAIAIINEKTT